MTTTLERFRGCLLGLAAGDALGATTQFYPPGTFEQLSDIIGGGSFHLKPGQWTDDTSMALCLATSLVETGRFDPLDQMQRYWRWYSEGYLSSKSYAFDIGGATRASLERFHHTGDPFSGKADPQSAGNGSLMRLAPVSLFYATQPEVAIEKAGESSYTTHGACQAADACRYFAGLLVGVLQGVSKEELLSTSYSPIPGYWQEYSLHPEIAAIAKGSFKSKEPPEIYNGGYVVPALEAALWAFNRSTDFRSGALLAANLGDDADTVAAIYGQIAGAFYGVESIPAGWREKLSRLETIEELAARLFSLSLNQ
jgi:ADP-ribosylglycohydrolase